MINESQGPISFVQVVWQDLECNQLVCLGPRDTIYVAQCNNAMPYFAVDTFLQHLRV